MKNFYKEQIEKVAMEKIAARAWKKALGTLSDASRNRLVNSGVLNYDKELKGLRRGTHAINKANSTKMVRKVEPMAGAYQEEVDNLAKRIGTPKFKDMDKTDLGGQSVKDILRSQGSLTLGSSAKDKLHSAKGRTNIARVPKNAYNDVASLPDIKSQSLKKIPRRDRDAKKWTQAIIERHEADEGRYVNKIKDKQKYTVGGNRGTDTQYFSHINPKVMQRESANVAIAPKSAQKYMKNLRRISGEINDMPTRNGGKAYGSSGVYDKQAGKKIEKSIRQQTNGILNQLKNDGIESKRGWGL